MISTTNSLAATLAAVVTLTAVPAMAQLDYSQDLGTDFDADFVDLNGDDPPGPMPDPSTPQFGPNDEWEFRASEGNTVISRDGGLPASGQAGWCEGNDADGCTTGADHTYFANEDWGAAGLTDAFTGGLEPWLNTGGDRDGVLGHGNQQVIWTAPPAITEGGVHVDIDLTQLFESSRQMRLKAAVNGPAGGNWFFDAVAPDSAGMKTNVSGSFDARVNAGDTIVFDLVPSGLADNPDTPTFSAFAITITEAVIPEPASAALLGLGALCLLRLRRRR